ncbi:MAG: T9SS type A sorting domain-containing protein [Ignavibacteriales bacterium]
MMLKILLFTILLLSQSILQSQTNPNIWYVTPTGSGNQTGTNRGNAWSLSSMNQNIIQPGDFVFLGQGIYTGQLKPTKSGKPNKLITWMADPINTIDVLFQGTMSGTGVLISNVNYTIVKGIKVRTRDTGIQVGPGVNVVYVDSMDVGFVEGCVWIRGNYDVANPTVAQCDSVWIRWCDLRINTQTSGQTDVIAMAWVNNIFIIGNRLYQDNKLGSNHNDCIQTLPGIGNVTVANNLLINEQEENSQIGMINQEWAGYRWIYYNNVSIQLGNGPGWAHWNATGSGVQIRDEGRTFVYHNTMFCLKNANNFGKSDTLTARNNIVYTATSSYGPVGVVNTPIPSTYSWNYNCYYNPATNNVVNINESIGRSLSYWQGVGQEYNGMRANPLFTNISGIDPLAFDFSLQSNSPAFDAGTNLQSIVTGWGIEGVEWTGFDNPFVSWGVPIPRDSDPTLGAWEYHPGGNYIRVNTGWNIISIPKLCANMTADYLLPTRTSDVLYFNGNEYITVDVLQNGLGYLVKFGYPQFISIEGDSVYFSIPVLEGWNMIGVFEENVLVSQITTNPPGIIASSIFGYENGYINSSVLKPGKGYWLRASSDGVINLNTNILGKNNELTPQIDYVLPDWDKIKIDDSRENSISLFITEEEQISELYDLPPKIPSDVFDVRYRSGKIVENINDAKEILIISDNYPITIKSGKQRIKITDKINGKMLNEVLESGQELVINDKLITSIEITNKITEIQTNSFELLQNYPNPFNPSTEIVVHLPEKSNIRLEVYNTLGELVQELANGNYSSGTHKFNFDASSLPSGIYFYKIESSKFTASKKMIVLK